MEESFDVWEAANIAENDLDGNLLAEYLRKKTKKVFTRRIFELNGNKRASVEVCLRPANLVEKENRAVTQQNENPETNGSEDLENKSLSEHFTNAKDTEEHSASFYVPLARSPLASYMKRTPHSSDRLRRHTLRRLTHKNSGRRTLLDQFNNVMDMERTQSEFEPQVASTPVCDSNECQPDMNILKSPSDKNTTNQNDAPSSPNRCTIEKGKSPGELLLTPLTSPNKNHLNELSGTCNTKIRDNNQMSKQTEPLKSYGSQKMQTLTNIGNYSESHTEGNSYRSGNREGCKEQQRKLKDKLEATKNILVPQNTSLHVKAITTEIIVPALADECLNKGVSGAVCPSEPESVKNGDETFNTQSRQLSSQLSDNLTEMMTHDKEPEPGEFNHEVNKSKKKEDKFLTRTRKSRKKEKKNLKTTSDESDLELPRMTRLRKCLTLNKAPRTPINGEKYAPELKKQLSGLSNLKILDLRKRKSNTFTKRKSKKDVNTDLLHGSANSGKIVSDCVIEKGLVNESISLQPEIQCFQNELFENERSCDQVSFLSTDTNTISYKQKVKRGVKTPEIYKSYKNATQQVVEMGRKLNEKKRSLYSNVSIQELTNCNEIVPPPPMFRSSTPRKLATPSIVNSSEHNNFNTVDLNESLTNKQSQKDDGEFKKPKGVPLKQKKAISRQKTVNNKSEEQSSLRRSKRCRKEVPKSLFWIMWEKNFLKSIEEKQKKKNASKSLRYDSKLNNNSDIEMIPIACSTANPKPILRNDARKKVRNNLEKSNERKKANVLVPIAEASKSTEQVEETKKNTKHLRVKIKRLNANNTLHQSKMVSSSSSPNLKEPSSALVMTLENCQENFADRLEPEKSNFLSWLKDLTNEQTVSNSNWQNPPMQMNFSSRNELTFTSFNDVDYAFYNTKEKNFLGYIRFQPRQIKPPSRAKQHNLHFLILSGKFKIISNEEPAISKEGDLVSINQGCRYSIENLSDDVGIVFFVKK